MVGRPEVADALIPMLKDNPGRKAGLLKAIGKSVRRPRAPSFSRRWRVSTSRRLPSPWAI
jgi:hypothetical protein